MVHNELAAQQSLANFYVSVQFQNPAMALLISDDIRTIALYGLLEDKQGAYEAVIRVRNRAQGLPAVHERILDHALEDLGFLLNDVYKESE